MKKALIVFTLFLLGENAWAQPSEFSTDPAKFLTQAIGFLADEDKSTAKEFKEKFEPVWLNEYTDAQRSQVYKIANGLLAKSVRPFPEFYDFLQSIYAFKTTKQPESSFQAWILMIDKAIANKDRKLLPDLLKMSAGLFTTGYIFENASVQWRCRSKNYKFEYDKQPRVIFESLDLVGYAKGDSCMIHNTSGVYSPVGNSWEGKGGTIDWSRFNTPDKIKFPTNETYAEIKRYRIGMKTVAFDADSVLFHTPYFKKPLAGELTEKVGSGTKNSPSNYPQFNSYSKRLFIKDFYPGVDYEGGFMVQGQKIAGSGTSQQLAKIIFYRNGKPFLKAAATNLTLRAEEATTDKAFVSFYIENDSIYHPGINFKYTKATSTVEMVRDGQGIVMSPFYDTYHNLELASDAVKWKTDEPIVEFKPYDKTSGGTQADFSSMNYFIPALYDRLQGVGSRNPIFPISEVALRKDTAVLRVEDVASFMGNTVEEAVPVLYEMTTMGLVIFDNEAGTVTVKDKLKNFAEARAKKKDYDPLIFHSDIKGEDVAQLLKDLDKEKASIVQEIQQLQRAKSNFAKQQKDTAAIIKEQKRLLASLKTKKTSNAVLNLSNLDFTIYGIRSATLSDSQYVRIYPANEEVVVKKNRGFVFSGAVVVGSTEFFGNNLSYDYAENKINLPQADSMRLRVFPFNGRRDGQIRVTSVIRNVRGTVFIDNKDNKAGNKRGNERFPILDCVKESYVFYNKKSIYNSVYDSSKFFFKIAPFKMDSLDNFKTAGVNFAGDFYSAGILPPIKESLKVQKDYSLGFIRKAPPEGFSLYGDKAKFNNDIRLSDKGLQADGELNYLSSFARSTDFTLFPDSVSGIAQDYENKEQMKAGGLDVPQINGKNVYVCFVPKQKVFYASTIESSMKTYRDQSDYRGRLSLRPEGLTARGRFIFGTAELKAKLMKCKSRTIDSDTADFKIKSLEDKNTIAIGGPNLNAHIDFDKRLGDFKKNNSNDYLTLGEIQYICYMDRFKWFMDREDIQLESDKRKQGVGDVSIDTDLDLTGSNFYSVHPDQDSLNFMAPKARFDLRKKIVYCDKVEYITVADARITPDSNKVIVRKGAAMDELVNAKIVANYITKYHSIFNARVKISARRKYVASGDYTYMDENKYEQKIHFNNISPDSSFQTFAKGQVDEKEKFALSPNFEYKGKVILKAADIGLNFDGYTRIAHKCKDVNRNWFHFKAVIDPQNIMIPIDGELLSDNNKPLGSGIYMNLDTLDIVPYPAFLSEKQNPKNPQIFGATGFLVFDKTSQEYRIGTQDKLKELSLPGNYISLHKEKCDIFADGKVTFLTDPNLFKINTVGSLTLKGGQLQIKGSLMLDFPFNDNLLEKFADKINELPDPVVVEIEKTGYIKLLRELMSADKADKVEADLTREGKIKKWPEELSKAIVLADITFKYNPIDQVYVSVGKIGLAHLFKKEVFKYISGKVVVKRGKKEDIISIILEDESGGTFFAMKYTLRSGDGIADVMFNDESSNNAIQEAKDDKKKFKGQKGEKDFEYRLGTKTMVNAIRAQE